MADKTIKAIDKLVQVAEEASVVLLVVSEFEKKAPEPRTKRYCHSLSRRLEAAIAAVKGEGRE